MSGRPTRTAGVLAAGVLGALLASGGWHASAAQTIALTGGTVHPVSGAPIENGTVVVRDGRVVAVGRDVAIPADADRIDVSGRVITPGFFDVGSRLGLLEVGSLGDTQDYALAVEDPVRAAFDVVDGINPSSGLIAVNRLRGVTTALTSPAGGLISGQAAVIDLAGDRIEELLVRPRAAMFASFDADDAGGARGGVSLRLREVLDDARFWARNRDAFDRGSLRELSASRLDLAALQPVLSGEIPLIVHADRASDIQAVLRIAAEYDLDLIIRGGTEAWRVADDLSAAGVPVIVKPLTNAPGAFDRLGARFDNAALLREAGVDVMLTSFETHRAGDLAWEAGNAIRAGLPAEDALRAVTLTPAVALGLADSYGSIEPGRVANLVVWTGDPFELSSRPERVMIRGAFVPPASRQRALFERYRTLDPRVPPAYR